MPAPAWERGTQSRPALSWVFILYLLGIGEEEPCLGGAAPPAPPSHPAWPLPPLSFFCATVTRGLGEQQRGQAQVALRGERAMAEAWGLQGLPRAPFCPALQMMGVNSSGGQWVGGWGLLAAFCCPAAPALGFHLANKHWLWDWTLAFSLAQEGGWEFSPHPDSVLLPPLMWLDHQFPMVSFARSAFIHSFSRLIVCSRCFLTWLCVLPGTQDSELARQSHSLHNTAAPGPRISKIPILPVSFQPALSRGPSTSKCPEAGKTRISGEPLERKWGWGPWAKS